MYKLNHGLILANKIPKENCQTKPFFLSPDCPLRTLGSPEGVGSAVMANIYFFCTCLDFPYFWKQIFSIWLSLCQV